MSLRDRVEKVRIDPPIDGGPVLDQAATPARRRAKRASGLAAVTLAVLAYYVVTSLLQRVTMLPAVRGAAAVAAAMLVLVLWVRCLHRLERRWAARDDAPN